MDLGAASSSTFAASVSAPSFEDCPISDEGIGIDPGDRKRVFDVFQSLHSQDEHAGTGIGLALCEHIVERHGGDIWVDGEPGEGSTFTFTLPAERDQYG